MGLQPTSTQACPRERSRGNVSAGTFQRERFSGNVSAGTFQRKVGGATGGRGAVERPHAVAGENGPSPIPRFCGNVTGRARQGVVIDLLSPHGTARLLADARELAGFVDEMYETVADGDESPYLDLDHELASLQEMQFPFL